MSTPDQTPEPVPAPFSATFAAAIPPVDTRVTYPAGGVASAGVVLLAQVVEGRLLVVLDETAVHPVDATWPDQPADHGTLTIGGAELPIVDAVVGATDGETVFVGAHVPVKKGTEGWGFLVVHVLEAPEPTAANAALVPGAAAHVSVDAELRRALSFGHTACHLASLALNAALAPTWKKETAPDALGRPDFDGLAIERSRIGPFGSVDRYRIGKSLRRKGFDPASLDDPSSLTDQVDATLAAWVASDGAARIDAPGDTLTARRTWHCELPDGIAELPCGGTHVDGLASIGTVSVALETATVDGALLLTMRTSVVPRG
ncbi:metal-dependent hydrolase [Plantibacter sp. YIM 135249]|uniref:metal-dependent hydrolase n=1 Tax=Plantibacter sp. YIM 135249 TaxID=3423918 RepID=UPI003D358123